MEVAVETGAQALIQDPILNSCRFTPISFAESADHSRIGGMPTPTWTPPSRSCASPVDRARAADLGRSHRFAGDKSPHPSWAARKYPSSRTGMRGAACKLRLDAPFRDPAITWKPADPLPPQHALRVSDVAQVALTPRRRRSIAITASVDHRERKPDRIPLGTARGDARQGGRDAPSPGYQVVFGGSARTLNEASNDFRRGGHHPGHRVHLHGAGFGSSTVSSIRCPSWPPCRSASPPDSLALMTFGMTLNVHSAIGMLMLFRHRQEELDTAGGLHQHTEKRRTRAARAPSWRQTMRLRPILMTTLSIVAGMILIAFRARRRCRLARASMAVTILGGQVLCLLHAAGHAGGLFASLTIPREWDWTSAVKNLWLGVRPQGHGRRRDVLRGGRPLG